MATRKNNPPAVDMAAAAAAAGAVDANGAVKVTADTVRKVRTDGIQLTGHVLPPPPAVPGGATPTAGIRVNLGAGMVIDAYPAQGTITVKFGHKDARLTIEVGRAWSPLKNRDLAWGWEYILTGRSGISQSVYTPDYVGVGEDEWKRLRDAVRAVKAAPPPTTTTTTPVNRANPLPSARTAPAARVNTTARPSYHPPATPPATSRTALRAAWRNAGLSLLVADRAAELGLDPVNLSATEVQEEYDAGRL